MRLRNVILSALLVAGSTSASFAQAKQTPQPDETQIAKMEKFEREQQQFRDELTAMAANDTLCESVVRKAIIENVKQQGFTDEIGFDLVAEAASADLLEYVTSVFIVSEGYITDSGAQVVVRKANDSCSIVSLHVSVK